MSDCPTTHRPHSHGADEATGESPNGAAPSRLMRTLLILLGACTLALGSAGLASAAKPIRVSEAVSFSFTADCSSFEMLVEVEGKQIAILFLGADAEVTRVLIAAPAAKASLTNLDTGASMSLAIGGPAHIDVMPDGEPVRFVGPWLLDFNPETGEPGGLFFVTGQVRFNADATGMSDLSFSGRAVDVCAELAA